MRILALDSATSRRSMALLADGKALARSVVEGSGQSDGLPLEIAALLDQAGVAIAGIDGLAVTVGPGRFTGLRAGLAFMRGLALATGKPLIGVTTLEAIAAGCRPWREPEETLLAVVDSRRAELFFQLFAPGGESLGGPFAARADSLASMIGDIPRLLLAGEQVESVKPAIAPHVGRLRVHPALVDAVDVGVLATSLAIPTEPPAPLYIHPPATTAPRRAVGLAP